MDQFPKCLFKEGTETQVEKVNNTCRASILESVKTYIKPEYDDVLLDPVFSQIMAIYEHKLRYSGRVVHTFICKQLLTAKLHELWFHFARRPLRFSMQEFHAITGLKYEDEHELEIDGWRDDKGFWSKLLKRRGNISLKEIRLVYLKSCHKWSHVDRLRLVYLCVIAGLVMAKDEKVWIPHKYIKLVMDFDKMRAYPWGLHSFDALVSSIVAAREKVKTQKSYVIDGFSYALQIWLMEAIPDIGSLLGQKLRQGVTSMRCRNWKGSAKVSYEDIISIETDFGSTGKVFPYISSVGNDNIIGDAGFERADEMKDERVDLIIEMYRKNYDWSKHVWDYQETVQPYVYSSDEDSSEEQDAVDTSENGMEEEVVTTPVSAARKRKKQFQDIGAESRKKRLLCQRSTEKYRDLEVEMKSYIHGLFKESFTALSLEVRDTIEDRFTKFEEMVLSRTAPAPHAPVTDPAPAHDPNDCEVGKRHNLEFINILTDDGKINENGGPDFAGMPRFAAREAVVEALKNKGLYRGAKNNEMRLGLCQRTGDVIEPIIKPQWYVNCRMIAKEALDVAVTDENKKLEFIPKQYTAEWKRWLENIRDWCISRQLWWGHRIPAWYATLEEDQGRGIGAYNDHWIVARTEEEARKEAAEKFSGKKYELTQDHDVLDTWFSSGLFPLSVLGWPDETDDLKMKRNLLA